MSCLVDLVRIPACRQAGNSRFGNPAHKHKFVDPGRIELPLAQCECAVIPLYYEPIGPQIYVRGACECSHFVRIFDSQTKCNPATAVIPDLHKNHMIFIYKSQSRITGGLCGGRVPCLPPACRQAGQAGTTEP